jgi:predicted HTH domain antitoxin
MHPLTIEIPENVLLATGQSREEFIREAKILLAAKLFELGRLSSGKAAQLCGMGRVDFLLTVSRMGIPVADLDEEEMKREFADV